MEREERNRIDLVDDLHDPTIIKVVGVGGGGCNAIGRVERRILERAPLRYQVEALCARLEERLGSAS